jgi:hypothetical protein
MRKIEFTKPEVVEGKTENINDAVILDWIKASRRVLRLYFEEKNDNKKELSKTIYYE